MIDALLAPWVWITIAAAFAQNLRSILQRRLTRTLSVHGAAYVRFVYGLPVAWLVVWGLGPPPIPESVALWVAQRWDFLAYAAIGGVAQIIGTVCLVLAVSRGNFALGTALSKTEAAQAAVVGLVVLADSVSGWLAAGIGLSFVGVCMLLNPDQANATGSAQGAATRTPRLPLLAGIAAGTGFAISAVCFRGASLSLPEGSVVQRAALTVAVALTLQTIVHGLYIALREPGQLRAVAASWPVAAGVGVIGALASLGWFTAMSMESAGRVRALGQIEMVFTLITSRWLLGERLRLVEGAGLLLILSGLALLL